ncbi:MAG: tRNA nucleotidyltransferase [Clostridia bacterium]|nr:tRNA nucleotidyltransferase [Clostridia bacterium]
MDALHGAGHRAYVVGGCVRDSLLGKTPHDWDICTDATPRRVMEIFGEGRCIPTGMAHGTVTVKACGSLYEVTTFRTEGSYSDGRHPDSVAFIGEVEGDLARRDFTINAMAYGEKEGLIDPFGGREDLLCRRIVRAVGVPERRFEEDALRILRLFRFAAREGLNIDAATLSAALALSGGLRRVSAERIREELTGILLAPKPGGALPARVVGVFLPEAHALQARKHPRGGTAYDAMLRVLDASEPERMLRLAAFFLPLGEAGTTVEAMARRLRFDAQTVRTLCALAGEQALVPEQGEKALRVQARRCLGAMGLGQLETLAAYRGAQIACGEGAEPLDGLLRAARSEEAAGFPCRIRDLAVTGRDLMRDLGVAPGPQVGRLLETLLEAVIAETCENERGALLSFARRIRM